MNRSMRVPNLLYDQRSAESEVDGGRVHYIIVDETGSITPDCRYFAHVVSVTEDYGGFGEVTRHNRNTYGLCDGYSEFKAHDATPAERKSFLQSLKEKISFTKAKAIDLNRLSRGYQSLRINEKTENDSTLSNPEIRLALLNDILDDVLTGMIGRAVIIIDEHTELNRARVREMCASKSNEDLLVEGDTYPSQITADYRNRILSRPDAYRHLDVLQAHDYVTYAVRRNIAHGDTEESDIVGTVITFYCEGDKI